jgi:hypothetical protein
MWNVDSKVAGGEGESDLDMLFNGNCDEERGGKCQRAATLMRHSSID